MRPKLDLEQIKGILATSTIVASWQVFIADETVDRALYRIRCQLLRPTYQLEVRLIQAEDGVIYSYQLFSDKPILRWDNAPHFPTIQSFPHHFHDASGAVKESPLTADPIQDLPLVLTHVRALLTESSP